MNIEEALGYAGSWGKFQKRIYALIFLFVIPNALIAMHFVFSNHEPVYGCKLPHDFENFTSEGNGDNNSVLDAMNPGEVDQEGNVQKSHCEMYNITHADYISRNQTDDSNTTKEMISCTNGYIFDLKGNQMSAVAEFNMVCENDWKPALAVAIYGAGNGVGSLIASIADRFGRRRIFLSSCVFHVGFTVFMSMSWNSYVYIAACFFTAVFGQLNFIASFLIGIEMSDAAWRNFMGVGSQYSYSIGYCLVAGLGYVFQDWRWYLRVVSIISAFAYLPSFWLIPESPRWLALRGNTDDATMLLKKIAKTNGKLENFEKMVQKRKTKIVPKNEAASTGVVETLRILFKTGIGDRCLVLIFAWIVSSLVYYAISYYSKDFSDDRFLNVLYAGLAELPAYLCGFYLVKFIGGPRSMFALMVLCGLTTIILPFVPQDISIVRTVLSILGKGAVSAEWYIAILVTSEVVPTLQRSSNMSICSGFARVGSFVAPFLMYMGKTHPAIPNLIMGGLAIASGVLSVFFLPETKGLPIPDSAEDARSNSRIYGMKLLKKFDRVEHSVERKKKEKTEIL